MLRIKVRAAIQNQNIMSYDFRPLMLSDLKKSNFITFYFPTSCYPPRPKIFGTLFPK